MSELKEMRGQLRSWAIVDALDWGFPRELDIEHDIGATWYCFDGDVLLWLGRAEWAPGVGFLHMVSHPAKRRAVGARVRTMFRLLHAEAARCGFEALAAADCVEGGQVADYLHRLGWKPWDNEHPADGWMRFEIGVSDGERSEEAGPRPSFRGQGCRRSPGGSGIGAQAVVDT